MITREHEPMNMHTTFRVGGPARYYLIPEKTEEVKEAVEFATSKQLPYMVVGKGSNLLFSDSEYHGVVIEIGESLSDITINADNTVRVESGLALSSMAARLAKAGLKGFAFAGGIPGTVGGAIVMNAGAYGGEIKDCLKEATVMTENGELKKLTVDELDFSYRHSVLQDKNWIVLEAVFEFESGDSEEIQAEMRELNERRREKQPLEYPSAGSTFKRPEGYFAGKLIEDSELKGYHIGDAEVSSKHCGFVVNKGNATAGEIYSLIKHVQKVVKEKQGVDLETEVKLIGDFS